MGHDDYIKPMIEAAGNESLIVLDPHKGLPLLPSNQKIHDFEKTDKKQRVSYNSHTYIAINGAVQQIYNIAGELAKLSPENSDRFSQNAQSYAKSLRKMLAAALRKINASRSDNVRIATIHDGYAYLFSELGIEVMAVIQPRHGIEPNPRQLQDTIKRIQRANVNVLFAEVDYKKKYVDIIFNETGCQIYQLSHVSNGPYSKEKFALDMQKNLDTIVQAVTSGN
jgi:zinc transport system substrate-binding protein